MTMIVYDTTLRDGAQQEGLLFSVEDKLKILELLDELGVDYVEGGWPGSNPTDVHLFERAKQMNLRHAKLAAFGCTRRADVHVEDDANVRALIAADTPTATVFGKSAPLHVRRVLATSLDNNLRMIADTVAYLVDAGREVIFDAEHFFDGFAEDAAYAVDTLHAASDAGASTIVLCDTNGGSLPKDVGAAVEFVHRHTVAPIGIHAHNDGGLAVANTLVAVRHGATHVQGTINGYGERCGNADLCTVVPSLVLKLGNACHAAGRLSTLSGISAAIAEIANHRPDPQRPYVGTSAFAHKGGMHVDALAKCTRSYQHVDPQSVGNRTRSLVSSVSGRASLRLKADEFRLRLTEFAGENAEEQLLSRIKHLEHLGFQFEGADASVELLIRRLDPGYSAPFRLDDFHVLVQGHPDGGMRADASVKICFGSGEKVQTAADGNGPVNALDAAVRKALEPKFPEIGAVRLADYKVRILDTESGTAAKTRVLVTSTDGERRWCTVGCGTNIIEASWLALADSYEYALVGSPVACGGRNGK